MLLLYEDFIKKIMEDHIKSMVKLHHTS